MAYDHDKTNKDFPVSIDLGKEAPKMMATPDGDDDESEDSKKYFPTLYIDGVEGLESLPDEGCALIKFKVRRDSTDRESGKSSCELEVQSICLPKNAGAQDYKEGDEKDTGDMVDDMAREAGVKTKDSDDE